ncbi:MAG: hypothetical protein IJU41_04920 [Clostridia bacterium]|nr:hypothetical protein [Clostridia bacterium]
MRAVRTLSETGEKQPEQNAYYQRVSKKLQAAKYLLLLFFVLCAALTFFAYRKNITYDNLRYLLRDVDAAGHLENAGDKMTYTPSDTNFYAIFRGDLAVASGSGLSLCRALGSRSFDDRFSAKSPVAATSEKYMVVYDVGGNDFYVYNSLGRVYDGRLEYPVYDAAAADDGHFALLTRDVVGAYVIYVYNRDFKIVSKLSRQNDVADICFVGKRLCLCELRLDGGYLCTDVSTFLPGGERVEPLAAERGFPLAFGGRGSGYYLLLSDGLIFYDKNGEKEQATSFVSKTPLNFAAGKDAIALVLDEKTADTPLGVYVYTTNGKSDSLPAESGLIDLCLLGKKVCLLYDGKLILCGDGESRETEIEDRAVALFATGGTVTVCYQNYAKQYAF